ncbi:MAG TPA: DMT family transporter [Nevskiaceae bacterium]|nr:DMT family transporter [Nevskiaceae bacterium]
MRTADYVRLLTLAAIWGSSFIFMRVLAPVLGPVVTADARILIAGSVLSLWFAVTGFALDWKREWRQYLVIGAISSALPFMLFAYAAAHIPAGFSAIYNSTAPLFGAVCGALWLGERFTFNRGLGLFAGLAGVALVSRASSSATDEQFAPATLACLGAAACYALGGVYLKRRASHLKPAMITAGSQLAGGLLLLPLTPMLPPAGGIDATIVLNGLALALMCSGAAYLIYYRLIADIGPTRALSVTFLIPVFGLLWAFLFLGERITGGMLTGCALVLVGTWLVTRSAAPVQSRPASTVGAMDDEVSG